MVLLVVGTPGPSRCRRRSHQLVGGGTPAAQDRVVAQAAERGGRGAGAVTGAGLRGPQESFHPALTCRGSMERKKQGNEQHM
jgi:hypothetical protein